MKRPYLLKIVFAIIILISSQSFCGDKKFVKVNEFDAPEARQGVAVDENYIYVVGSTEIAKYDKKTNKLLNKWVGKEDGPIKHLDSGVIVNGKLYCAHSNYPEIPMTSSVEIWDAETLEHIDNVSFGIHRGSLTWVDYFDGNWYAAFGHYKKWEHATGKDASWTSVVKFGKNWIELESWVFPNEVIEKFDNMSNSGGSFGPNGLLYVTGHDAPELYVLQFPKMGSILDIVDIISIENTGQGIAWDRSEPNYIYCIKKNDRKVTVSKMINN